MSAWDLRIACMWEHGCDSVNTATELGIKESDPRRETNRVRELRRKRLRGEIR